MKKLLLFIIFLSPFCCKAQNYQCLQSGVKHYFLNGNNYLRGIRIDSVRTIGDTTFYYPFHTPRGIWYPGVGGPVTGLDSNGGSWLGKKVAQLTDGTFLFDNLWGDTVIIDVQAALGDSWLFYRDTSGLYYKATVTSIDTMTFLGILDSVKTITINSYHDGALNTSDSLNGFQIVLSKNNGFVQVFDLYTFPYHSEAVVYGTADADFYLDQSLLTPPGYFSTSPGVNNSIYKLATFINPTISQLDDWNIGDVFENANNDTEFTTPAPMQYILDTIIGKTVLPHSTIYKYSGLLANFTSASSYVDEYYGGNDTLSDTTYLFDTSKMPEETGTNIYSYYYPNDSSYCFKSPAYVSGFALYLDGVIIMYKIGFGQTYNHFEEEGPLIVNTQLIFSNKSNNPCGSYYPLPPLSTPSLNATNTLTIFPNPTTESLNIQSTNQLINKIQVTNLFGQTVISKQFAVGSLQCDVDVSALPAAVYFIQVNLAYRQAGNTEVKKFVKE